MISEIAIPNRDGFHFIQDVRRIPALDGVRAIALSALASTEETALLAGFDMCLCKPISPLDLLGSVRAIVEPRSGTIRVAHASPGARLARRQRGVQGAER